MQHVQAFHTNSKPLGISMKNCSTSMGYVQASATDISEQNSEHFTFVKFGGQSTETGRTTNKLYD